MPRREYKKKDIASRQVLTTGQIATICQVAPRTVSKWIDRGILPGYRVPDSLDRRVRREDLLRFLEEHGMSADGLGMVVR